MIFPALQNLSGLPLSIDDYYVVRLCSWLNDQLAISNLENPLHRPQQHSGTYIFVQFCRGWASGQILEMILQ